MNKYRIKYSLESAPGCVFVKDIQATGPVRALDMFHKDIQVDRGIAQHSYKVGYMGLMYSSDAFGRTDSDVIESSFDLPKCENPNMKPVKSVPADFTSEAWW
jgi:hypothetical protein